MKLIQLIYIQIMIFTILPAYLECSPVRAEISFGELVDKITILKIKSERITQQEKLSHIHKELTCLQQLFDQYIGNRDDIQHLMQKLKAINTALWDIEDAIRLKERIKEFNHEFIELARNVYITNDARCATKRAIDTIMHSEIVEEKSYEQYQ